MRVGLFIPCYIDQFYPDVGLATVEVLERYGCQCEYPVDQTCCGQPMANSGCAHQVAPLARLFVKLFHQYDYVVSPSGSCVSMIRNHYDEHFDNDPQFEKVRSSTYELCEFLTKILHVEEVDIEFPYKVALHPSCHGLRELRLGNCSEVMNDQGETIKKLLQSVKNIELASLKRNDECCGFGGTFAVVEEGVSVLMGKDRLADFRDAAVQVVTATDVSCLMHMQGLARRMGDNVEFMHIAQIFAGRKPTSKAAAK
jgi:L-lactate dehydrogenase complex protein LldE